MNRHLGISSVIAIGLAATVVGLFAQPAQGQGRGNAAAARPSQRVARAADGKPDLSGMWQALTSASWNLLDHAAARGPVTEMGALGAIPGGVGVVEGGVIPYQPWAAAKQKENAANWLKLDPVVKCFLPGIPRATYMPFPFQIVQTPGSILFAYEFASGSRTVYINGKDESPTDTWMGWANGRWEGDTLVVDVTSFNDETWFDSVGDFHSEALHVVERYTPKGPDHLDYEATIEDPKVFTRPWKIHLPLYRRIEPRAQLMEFKCVEFVEELMYGHLRKGATAK
jgi:hypothetical protein